MDKQTLDMISQDIPDLNPRIMGGITTEQGKFFLHEINKIFEVIAKHFPPGVEFHGAARCTPEEEYRFRVRPRNNKSEFELARTDSVMIYIKIVCHGEELPKKYTMLPYISDENMMYIRGKVNMISPVLIDPAFSIGLDSMFLQMTSVRFVFERFVHHYIVDGENTESTYVARSWLHHKAKRVNSRKTDSSRIKYSTMGHYILAKYGLSEALRIYADGASCIVSRKGEISRRDYPIEQWVFLTTFENEQSAKKFAKWEPSGVYTPSDIVIAIRRDQYTDKVRLLMASVWYVIDKFPSMISPDEMDIPEAWEVLLGHVLKTSDVNEGIMIRETKEHLRTLDEYLDDLIKDELTTEGIPCDTFYDVLYYVMESLASITRGNVVSANSPFAKRLTTSRYVLSDIISGINNIATGLKKLYGKKPHFDAKDVMAVLNENLYINAIGSLGNGSRHPESTPVANSCECTYHNITSGILTQDRAAAGSTKKTRTNLSDPKKHLQPGQIYCNTYTALKKADPTGGSTLNPCVELTPEGRPIYPVKHDEMIRSLTARYY